MRSLWERVEVSVADEKTPHFDLLQENSSLADSVVRLKSTVDRQAREIARLNGLLLRHEEREF